jgi:hypothetical protein
MLDEPALAMPAWMTIVPMLSQPSLQHIGRLPLEGTTACSAR